MYNILYLYIYYQELNNITIENLYSLLNLSKYLDSLLKV